MKTTQRPDRTFAPAALVAVLACGLAAFAPGGSPQPPATIPGDVDDEERQELRAGAERSVRENCLICHSSELITTQRLTPKQWAAEVEKMAGWGAPLPREQQSSVIDYLASEYPDRAAPARLERLSLREASSPERPEESARSPGPGVAARGASSYARNCANCHGEDGQGAELGPNLVEKPVLWRPRDYDEVVRKGRGRMPGFTGVVDAAGGSDVLAWLRARRYRPRVPGKT